MEPCFHALWKTGLTDRHSHILYLCAQMRRMFQNFLVLWHCSPVACEEFAPVFLLQFDAELPGGLLDALPCFIPLFVGHALYLVEARYSFLNMAGIFEGFLAFLREGKGAFREVLSVFI